jgi:hypothetical protein
LLDNVPFWTNASAGVAAFVSPEIARIYRLPITFQDQVLAADRFQIKPIVPLLTDGGRFYVLALSQKSVRLFQGSREAIHEVSLPDSVPKSYDEALQSDWTPEQRNFHTHAARAGNAGAREAIFHGQSGVVINDAKEGFPVFAQKVDHGLQHLLANEQAPLILAGVEFLLAIYRQATTYPHLLAEAINGSPDQLNTHELLQRAWPLVVPHFQDARKSIAALNPQLSGTGRASNDLAQIVEAAHQEQIQYHFVPVNQERWGRFDETSQKAEIHDRAEAGDEDLFNFAAVHALSHKGTLTRSNPKNCRINR